MNSYDNWAKFYDEIYGERSDNIKQVLKLINKYAPNAKTVLDIACGTGIVTNGLSQKFTIEGLDLSEGQIEVAKSKYPNIPFHQANMTSFKLDKKFDVALCLFNSINHLSDFNDWKKTFTNVKKHLNQNGTFIFDVNTISKLERLSNLRGAILNEFGNVNYRLITLTNPETNRYDWNIKVFENLGDSNYKLHKDIVKELGVPLELITNALKNTFENIGVYTLDGNIASEESSIAFFVCK